MIGRGPLFLLFFAALLLVSFSLLFNTHFNLNSYAANRVPPLRDQPIPPPGFAASSGIVPSMPASDSIVHIVLFQFKEGTPSDGLKGICDAFVKLKDDCIHPETQKPYILSIKAGLDNSQENLQRGYTHAFVVEFATLWDRDYYVEKDPAHDGFKKALDKGGLASALVIDFQNGVY
ncbi:hypothetical protein TWF694_001987 [Orbilia ellipsospora]|uniref:Stress-response A/B barrel domain-containing protein n=1 Tax=Orbilia ellipsospora TaxID=2528407 RepID=A0AAV9X498_9PEZI